jgi:hypothetical protein
VFKRKLAVVAVAASLLIGLPSAAAAFTSYADPAIEVFVNPTTLVGGNSFDGYATSNGVDCDWTVKFRGQTQTGSGTRIDFSFDTPEVSEETRRDLKVTCSYDDTTLESLESPTSSTGVRNANYVVNTSTALPAAIQELERAVRITILSRSSDDDDDDDDDDGDTSSSGLPGTGGIDAGWIYGGVALLLVGSATVIVSRRRNESNA